MKQLNREQQQLVEQHLHFARALTDWINHTNLDRKDLYGAAYYGLSLAALNYKKDNDTMFSTFAHWYVIGYVLREIKLLRGTETSIDDLCVGTDDDNETDYDRMEELGENPFERMDDIEYVRHIISYLPEWEGEVISYMYGLDGKGLRNVHEVAEHFAVTEDTIYDYLAQITCHLRKLTLNQKI